MIFRRLSLTNFGVYAGTQLLDLSPDASRPIVLVGGHNGAGKTTILEALLLCLHGRRGLGAPVSQREYDEQIKSRFHSPAVTSAGADRPTEAALGLEFTHAEAGVAAEYVVERRWHLTPKGNVKERLSLSKGGEQQEDLTGSMTQNFLDGLMPPALASLFLFDGEKIQNLADDESGRELRDAVRRLLGLDLLERLGDDLTRYATKAQTSEAAKAIQKRVTKAHKDKEDAVATVDAGERDQSELAAERDRVNADLAHTRQRFDQEGGAIAQARADLERKHTLAERRVREADGALRQLITGLLPLAVCMPLVDQLAERLRREAHQEEDEIIRRRLEAMREEISRHVSVKGTKRAAPEVLMEVLAGPQAADARVHDISATDRVRMLDSLGQIGATVAPEAKAVARKLRRAKTEEASLREALSQAPDETAVAPLLRDVQDLSERRGVLEKALADGEKQLARLRHRLGGAEAELARAREALEVSHQAGERAGLALRAAALLAEFGPRTAAAKIEAVQTHTAQYFNRLSRKGEMLAEVSIDLDTFALRVRRWDQTEISKSRLSAGERQILAVALLWALATVSGRSLPVVIDTPLARLDAEHRRKLVQDYLPTVSHQVIVLSTDTEIDEATAELLRPAVSRSYRLEHDGRRFATTVTGGYWGEGAAADAR